MDPTNAPAAIPWWQSRIIWTQIVGLLFAVAASYGLNLQDRLGIDQAAMITSIMAIVNVVTIVVRAVYPVPQVTATKASAHAINQQAALAVAPQPEMLLDQPVNLEQSEEEPGPNSFSGQQLKEEAARRTPSPSKAKPKASKPRAKKNTTATAPPTGAPTPTSSVSPAPKPPTA